MNRFVLFAALMACSKANPTQDTDRGLAPAAPEIKVALAGVTLAEDCGDGVPTKPLSPPPGTSAGSASAVPAMQPKVAADMPSAGACAPGYNCGGLPQPACEQTAMQLSVQVPAGAGATRIKIKQVELLDETGKVVGTLTARAPSK